MLRAMKLIWGIVAILLLGLSSADAQERFGGMTPTGSNAILPTGRINLGLDSIWYTPNVNTLSVAGCPSDGTNQATCLNTLEAAAVTAGGKLLAVPNGTLNLGSTVTQNPANMLWLLPGAKLSGAGDFTGDANLGPLASGIAQLSTLSALTNNNVGQLGWNINAVMGGTSTVSVEKDAIRIATTQNQPSVYTTPSFTASISGTTMTVTAIASGVLGNGQLLVDVTGNLLGGTTITAIGTCNTPPGTCTVSQSQTVASEAMTSLGAATAVNDSVGLSIYSKTGAANLTGRIFGLAISATMPAGSNGRVLAAEFASNNSGIVEPFFDQVDSKVALHLTTAAATNPSTGYLQISGRTAGAGPGAYDAIGVDFNSISRNLIAIYTAPSTATSKFSIDANGVYSFSGSSTVDQAMLLDGTNTSATTSTIYGLNLSETFAPTGASISAIEGIAATPVLGTFSLNVGTFRGMLSQPRISAGYAGTLTSSIAYDASFSNSTATAINNVTGFQSEATTNGNGATSGSSSNIGFNAAAETAAAGAGGTVTNIGEKITVGTGSGAGTTHNRGIYITGNGGSGGGGTTTNFAILSDSTALVHIAGPTEHVATTLPTSAAGTLGISGEAAVPTFAANGEAALFITSTTGGISLMGKGSTNDLTIYNAGGTSACVIATGTTTLNCTGLSVSGTSVATTAVATLSSLTSVGALAAGTIASGFGTIATANTITGTEFLVTAPVVNTAMVALSGQSLTGSNASNGLSIAGTWNTSGAPNAILVNMTDTASDTAATLLNLQIGGTSVFVVGNDVAQNTVNMVGTNTSALTTAINGITHAELFNPAGASLTNLRGIYSNSHISGSSITVTTYNAFQAALVLGAGFSGTVTNMTNFDGSNPTISGTNPVTNFFGFNQEVVTNGNGITSGTVTNVGLRITAATAVPGSGGTINNTAVQLALASGVNAGTETARGLYITGNGPTGGGATVYAIDDESTAQVLLTGPTTTASVAVTSATQPTNGVYLPAASTVGLVGASKIEMFAGATNELDFAVTTAGTWTTVAPVTINNATFKVTTLGVSTAVDTVCYNSATGLFTEEPTGTTCTVSDERKKMMETATALSSKRSLEIIIASSPISYYYRPEAQLDDKLHLGFGAQTLARIDPQLVEVGDDGVPNAVKQIELLPVTWAAIKQLKADNDGLKREIAALRRRR